jgi:soluble lytic murein transglycosylase-like protein
VKIFVCLFAVSGLWAAEQAILHTGFRIDADRHEIEGETVRLYSGAGVIQLPASAIASFETLPDPPKPTPAAAPQPSPAPAPAAPAPIEPKELVHRAALRNGLPPELLHSVARVESAYRPDAVSPKGAIGIMQLMPGTAAMLNADPRDPQQNVEAGARHLRELLIRYNGETRKALAAYNAGAGAVERHQGVPPYAETQNYVEKVLRNYWQLRSRTQYGPPPAKKTD